jgi:hypothetical protein
VTAVQHRTTGWAQGELALPTLSSQSHPIHDCPLCSVCDRSWRALLAASGSSIVGIRMTAAGIGPGNDGESERGDHGFGTGEA